MVDTVRTAEVEADMVVVDIVPADTDVKMVGMDVEVVHNMVQYHPPAVNLFHYSGGGNPVPGVPSVPNPVKRYNN